MKYIKNHKLRHHINRWIGGWIELVHNIILILTLGFVYTGWDFKWACRCVQLGAKIARERKK